jgi:AhpD family alkylhydroperoxidase
MARISLDPPPSLSYRVGSWFLRRRFGEVLEPYQAMGHQPQVAKAVGHLEQQVPKWDRVDESLKDLADLAAAVTIGCRWCTDFGYWVLHTKGVPRDKIEAAPQWRDSDLFSPLERLVLEYAEAMTATPPTVDDDLVARLREHLDEGQLVELTVQVCVENMRSRFNAAMGLTGQGFQERCDLAPHVDAA